MSDLPGEIRRHGARGRRQLRGEIEKFVVEAAGIVKRHRDRERQIARRINQVGR